MRRVRARFHLNPRKKGRKGYIAKTVFKLVKYIFFRIKRLSRRLPCQYVTKTLRIIIKYRKPTLSLPANGLSHLSKLKTFKETIPLSHPADPNFLFIEFWHQLKKKALILQVIPTCKTIPKPIFVSAQYISLEAKDFIKSRVRKWKYNSPVLSEVSSQEEKENQDFENTIFMDKDTTFFSGVYGSGTKIEDSAMYPSLEPMEFRYEQIYGKIPMKKTELPPAIKKSPVKKSIVKKSPVKKSPKKLKLTELIVFHKRLKGQSDDTKKRQTRIEEYFKPRKSIDVGATSRGALKKQVAESK